jgi:anti-sigma factor RsiW
MTELFCGYGDDRDEVIVAFLYDDPDASPAERSRFETHLATCARCQADVAALRGVRAQLAHWSPPEPSFGTGYSPSGRQLHSQSAVRTPDWWRAIPAWAQVAAALLFLGVSAGIANLDVHYDHSGLSIRTGWSNRAGSPVEAARAGRPGATAVARGSGPSADAPWRADIAALEQQLKGELRGAQASTTGGSPTAVRTVAAPASDAEVIRRVRALVEESEKRQQRELALRVAELARDVTAQRQADLVKIDRTLGVVQNNVGIEVMKNRQQINQIDLLYRASQRQ